MNDVIIGRDDWRFFYIKGEKIYGYKAFSAKKSMISKVQHLDNMIPYRYYKNNITNIVFPVYYEHGDVFLTKTMTTYSWIKLNNMTPYHTNNNLNLL